MGTLSGKINVFVFIPMGSTLKEKKMLFLQQTLSFYRTHPFILEWPYADSVPGVTSYGFCRLSLLGNLSIGTGRKMFITASSIREENGKLQKKIPFVKMGRGDMTVCPYTLSILDNKSKANPFCPRPLYLC